MVVQLLAMLGFSTYQFGHFADTFDFAIYTQAWTAIAHGHLNPFDTLIGARFWRNDAEFVLWPLSLLYWIYPHPVVLLWVQDVAVVATEMATYGWVVRIVERSSLSVRARSAAAGVTAVSLVLNPWAWDTIAADFHPHAIATLFVVLAGRDIWARRRRRCWIWVAAALMCCTPAALYLIGVGAAAGVACRDSRRTALAVLAVGAAWFVVMTQIGADGVGGTDLASWYGALVGHHPGRVGVVQIAFGALSHPYTVARLLGSHWVTVLRFVAVAGLVGVVSPWGLFPSMVVFLPSALSSNPVFLRPEAPFQSWPALPFVLIGTVTLLTRWWQRAGAGRLAAKGAAVLWAGLFAVISATALPWVPSYWLAVSSPAASRLARIDHLIPLDAEVIADNGIVGRFATRSAVYALGVAGPLGTVPVIARPVAFVLSATQGVSEPPGTPALVSYLRHQLGAQLVTDRDGIYFLEWSPPAGTRSVNLAQPAEPVSTSAG